ncbi:hypothetical protein I7I53_00954 [Histoplasma capsulatum var. duboisii H88]|uniref:Uncharacterized protein n=1 Tax=Ajellomyces capsulatus (strain H88) TaxID=544711 RepID=A0A8A1LJL2_AJEC8|nr:hypothetical protein I7I53_00954 [Histoplasma capsulatum var. duboisii H88]
MVLQCLNYHSHPVHGNEAPCMSTKWQRNNWGKCSQVRRAFSEAPNPSGSKYHQDPDTRKVMSPGQIQNSVTHTSNLTKKNIVIPLVHPLDSNLSMSSTGNR